MEYKSEQKKKDILSGIMKGVKMHDVGEKMSNHAIMPMKDKMYYPSLHVSTKQVPELGYLKPGDTCHLMIDSKVMGFMGDKYHLEVRKVGKHGEVENKEK